MLKNYCRLCDHPVEFTFSKQLLKKFEVKYFYCKHCHCLQTENPYWLNDAYLPINERFDTGQFIRCLHNAAFIFSVLNQANLKNSLIVDYGCGSGLTGRILRDVGCNVWGYDAYAEPRLLAGFQVTDLEGAEVINLCEVVEHFSNPKLNFDEIFKHKPKLVIMQTGILESPNINWHYLAPEHGQHIFFLSENTLDYLAKKYNVAATIIGGHIIFFNESLINIIYENDLLTVRPDFLSKINSSAVNLINELLINGYTYPILDNELLNK